MLKTNYQVPLQDIIDKYEAAKFNARQANNLGARVDIFKIIEEELQDERKKRQTKKKSSMRMNEPSLLLRI